MLRNQTVFSTARRGITILALLCAAWPAQSATVSTTFSVTATVLASCAVTATDLDFGVYAPGSGSDTTANSSIDVTCSNGAGYTITLDGGSVAHDMTARQMSDGNSHTLSYGLYTDSSCTTIWGDGTGSTGTVSGTGDGTPQSTTVYGKVPAGQYVKPTSYTDHISVTVTY